ncbi:MAG: 2-C-methyl-D-erythritol 4-phosphate cytidylyltransferase [Actinomycetota bacterium]
MQRSRSRDPPGRGSRIADAASPRAAPRSPASCAGILAAAGSGDRAAGGAGLPKQFREVAGRPLFQWSLAALLDAGCTPVIVAVPEALLERAPSLAASDDRVRFVAGGPHRQASVAAALEAVTTDVVVVHDAARPLASADLVRKVVAALDASQVVGAIPAVPVDETVKSVCPDAVGDVTVIDATVDRDRLLLAQTPQAFRVEPLREAHRRAAAKGFLATDDAQLIERYLGAGVAIVDGERRNVKVTHPEDMALVGWLMGAGR